MAQDNILDQFIEQVIAEAGIQALDAEFEREYREKMRISLARRLGTEALNFLDEPSFDEFAVLIEKHQGSPDPDAVLVFFKERVPDFETRVKDVFEAFKKDYLTAATTVK